MVNLAIKQDVEAPINVPGLPTVKRADFAEGMFGYFRVGTGGPALIKVVNDLPVAKLERMAELLTATKRRDGRVFIIGNGGSFDNSRALVSVLDRLGFQSQVAGNPDSYFSGDYSEIFSRGLKQARVGKGDVVVGLSGSGNSLNVLKAFTYAQSQGAEVVALGGRDGGRMRSVAGDNRSIIAATDNMEAIEDTHYAAGSIVAYSMGKGVTMAEAKAAFVTALNRSLTPGVIEKLTDVAVAAFNTIYNESALYVLGTGIGSNHFRADAGRGFTNCVPLRGLFAPETFTVSSAMATVNDDGTIFIIADGLAKIRIDEKRDFALLMVLNGADTDFAPVQQLLGSTSYAVIGNGGGELSFKPLMEFDPEFVASMVGHACGVTLRRVLSAQWEIKERPDLKGDINFNGQRKPSLFETLGAEARLQARGKLGKKMVLTYAYGMPNEARDPESLGLRRVHY